MLAAGQAVNPDDARKRRESESTLLEATQKRSKEVQAERDKTAADGARINARLLETGKLIHLSEAKLSAIEAQLGELQAQEKHLRGSLEQRHGAISALLAAMQRMGRNPPPVMVTRREDALTMVRSAMLLAAAYPGLKDQAIALSDELSDLLRVMRRIRTDGDRLREETGRLNDAQTRLAALQETKRQSLTKQQTELDKLRRSAMEIARNVDELSEVISKLDKEVADKTGLGSYEKEMADAEKRLAEPKQAGPAPPGEASRAPPAVVLAPTGKLAMLTPGRIKPAMPFADAKAQLPTPAQGKRVLTFGDRTQYGSQSKGLVIETRHGGQVVSPCDGWIVYAGEFRSYGQLLIINAGGGYHILLAGLSQIDVQLGQFVLTGEPVGVMSTGAKASQAKAQDNAPVLYIEFRKDGRPIDPGPWWADATRKVQE